MVCFLFVQARVCVLLFGFNCGVACDGGWCVMFLLLFAVWVDVCVCLNVFVCYLLCDVIWCIAVCVCVCSCFCLCLCCAVVCNVCVLFVMWCVMLYCLFV